ncbi:MAG: HEAT repeat domain-containing protein [Planctomycetota bacterium]
MIDRRTSLLLLAAAAATVFAAALAVGGQSPEPLIPGPLGAAPAAAIPVPQAPSREGRRDEAARGAYDLRTGDRLRIACELATTASLQQADAAPQQLGIALAGELQLLVAARRSDDLALVATMDLIRVRGGTPEVARELEAELRQGVVVQLGADGGIRGYRFPAGMTAERRNLVRTLIAGLRARLGGGVTWHVVDADATGEVELEGTADPAHTAVRMHKVAYRGGAGARLPTIDGETRLELAPAAGWWQEVRGAERCRIELPEAQLVIEAEAALRADLLAIAHGERVGPFDWQAPWAPASGADDRDAAAADPIAARLATELRGATFTAEAMRLQELLDAGADDATLHEARMRLIWLLRNDARALRELEGLLATAGQSQRFVAEVLSAVGAADTSGTQAFLAARLAGGGDSAGRVMTAQALFQGTGAATPIVQAIRATLLGGDATPELVGTSMLLLGALANRADGSVALQDLLTRGDFAREHGLVVDWLEALGNCGDAAVVDRALPSFAAADVAERAAATSAVRNVDDPRANSALADRAEHDESPIVRIRAIEALAGRGHGSLPALFRRLFEDDRDLGVRGAALLAFVRAGAPPEVATLLQSAAGGDPAPAIRQLAKDLLADRGA